MQVSFFNRNTVNVELFQYDYGQVLEIKGLILPKEFEVHYQNGTNTPVTVKGTFDEIEKVGKVNIPDECLQQDVQQFKAWLWVSDDKSGKTLKTIRFYLQQRDKPSNVPPISSVTEIKGYADYVKENAQKVAVAQQVGIDLLTRAESGAFNGKEGPQGPPGTPGQNGKQGPSGVAGTTPIKGVDYWNSEDKAEIDTHIDSKIKEKNFAEKSLVVELTPINVDETEFSTSHSAEQIKQAYQEGRTIYADWSGVILSFLGFTGSQMEIALFGAFYYDSIVCFQMEGNRGSMEFVVIPQGEPPVFSVNGQTGDVILKISDLQNDVAFATEVFVRQAIVNLVGTAPTTLDTLGEIAKALQSNETATGAIVEQLGQKANSSDLSAVSKSGSYNDLTDKPTVVIGDKTYTIKVSSLAPTVDDKNVITFVV